MIADEDLKVNILMLLVFVVILIIGCSLAYYNGFRAGVKAQYEASVMDADAYMHSDYPVNRENLPDNRSVEPLGNAGQLYKGAGE